MEQNVSTEPLHCDHQVAKHNHQKRPGECFHDDRLRMSTILMQVLANVSNKRGTTQKHLFLTSIAFDRGGVASLVERLCTGEICYLLY